jgi:hypothetical protein
MSGKTGVKRFVQNIYPGSCLVYPSDIDKMCEEAERLAFAQLDAWTDAEKVNIISVSVKREHADHTDMPHSVIVTVVYKR